MTGGGQQETGVTRACGECHPLWHHKTRAGSCNKADFLETSPHTRAGVFGHCSKGQDLPEKSHAITLSASPHEGTLHHTAVLTKSAWGSAGRARASHKQPGSSPGAPTHAACLENMQRDAAASPCWAGTAPASSGHPNGARSTTSGCWEGGWEEPEAGTTLLSCRVLQGIPCLSQPLERGGGNGSSSTSSGCSHGAAGNMVWGLRGHGGERDSSPQAPAHGIFARFLGSCSPLVDSKATKAASAFALLERTKGLCRHNSPGVQKKNQQKPDNSEKKPNSVPAEGLGLDMAGAKQLGLQAAGACSELASHGATSRLREAGARD